MPHSGFSALHEVNPNYKKNKLHAYMIWYQFEWNHIYIDIGNMKL